MLVVIFDPSPKNVNQLRATRFCGGSVNNTAMSCSILFLHVVINGQCFQYNSEYNLPNMEEMSHRSDCFLACRSGLKIKEPAEYMNVT
jgi:hypothetical protein